MLHRLVQSDLRNESAATGSCYFDVSPQAELPT